jgi:hypothetical protein
MRNINLTVQRIVLFKYGNIELRNIEYNRHIEKMVKKEMLKIDKQNLKYDKKNVKSGKILLKRYLKVRDPQIVNYNDFAFWCFKQTDQFNLSEIEIYVLATRLDVVIRLWDFNKPLKVLNWFLSYGANEMGYGFLKKNFKRVYEDNLQKKESTFGIYSYFNAGIGIGNYAKIFADKISEKYKIQKIDFPHSKSERINLNRQLQPVNIFIMGLDQTINLDMHFISHEFKNKYNILIPFWETQKIEKKYETILKTFDEIWAPTEFIYQTFRNNGPKIRKMPILFDSLPPNPQPIFVRQSKSRYFLSIFDIASGIDRKNLHGTIDAFIKYRNLYKSNDKLCIKTYSSQSSKRKIGKNEKIDLEKLRLKGIFFVQTYLSKTELTKLIDNSIALLSLHKSEGLGLNVIDAMLRKKKVIVTNYGGVTDFCNHNNSYLVDFDLKSISSKSDAIYRGKGMWAFPKIDSAVLQMRSASEDFRMGNNDKETIALEDLIQLNDNSETKIRKLFIQANIRRQIKKIKSKLSSKLFINFIKF